VRFSSIGDVLLTTPLLRALRARHPHARVTVLTKRQFAPLLQDNPRIDEVLGVSPYEPLRQVAGRLRAQHFSHQLDLHGSLRTRALRLLVGGAWRGFPKHRLAREVLIRAKRNVYPEDAPVAERYFAAAAELDVVPDGGGPEFFVSAEADAKAAQWLTHAGLGQDRPIVAFAPGAAHATRRWPVSHWIKLVGKVTDTGADALLVGGPDDSAVAAEIASRCRGRAASAAGELSLQGTGAVLKRASALVSGDTAAMHIATGVGTPVVALFGPTVRPFGFFPYNAHATVLERDLACRPCSGSGGPECPLQHHLCMHAIEPDSVFKALCRTLK
jgi:heptosyltransferase II